MKYHPLKTESLISSPVTVRSPQFAEFIHLDDPAPLAMLDCLTYPPKTITPQKPIDRALHDMQTHHVPFLLVRNNLNHIIGIIASEDLLGERPVQMMQEHNMSRAQLLVAMLMIPIGDIPAFNRSTLEHAKVGHIIETFKEYDTHYAFVIDHEADGQQQLHAIFSLSQLNRQLHTDISDLVSKTHPVLDLQK